MCGGPRDPWTWTYGPESGVVGRGGWEGVRGLRSPRGVHPIFKPQKVARAADKRTWRSTPSPALTRAPWKVCQADRCQRCLLLLIWAAAQGREF